MSHLLKKMPISGIEAMQEAVAGSDVVATQLSPGGISGSIIHTQLGAATLSTASTLGEFRAWGPLSQMDLTLGALLKTEGLNSQWAYQTKAGDIAVVPPCVEHNAHYGASTQWVTLALPLEDILERCVSLELPITEAFWQEPAMYRPPPAIAGLIVERFKVGLLEIERLPKLLEVPNARKALLDDLIQPLLLGFSIAAGDPIERDSKFTSTTRMLRSVEEYLLDHTEKPVRLLEICQHLDTPERTLNRAFQDVFGLSPGLYIRQWRLSRVRLMLTNPEDAGLTVTDAALRSGFWELGRFAQQYRGLFGELPSETLKRNKRS